MIENLYTANLELGLSFQDIEDFLALSATPYERPPEGQRLDYKEDVPRNLSKVVSAFANGSGGLVVLGIREENGIPQEIIGIQKEKSDLKTRLSNIIATNLEPSPRFKIAVIDVPGKKDRQLAVISIEAGMRPPYVVKGRSFLRHGDTTIPANLRQWEQLFATRRRLQHQLEPRSLPHLSIEVPSHEDNRPKLSDTYMTLWLDRLPETNFRIHRKIELDIRKIIETEFPDARKIISRGAGFFCLDNRYQEWSYHRIWRIDNYGRFSFGEHIVESRPQQADRINLIKMVWDMVDFLKCAFRIGDRIDRQAAHLSLGSLMVFQNAYIDCGSLNGNTSPCIADVKENPIANPEPLVLEVDQSEFTYAPDMAELVTEMLCWPLQNQRAADIDFGKLRKRIEKMIKKDS